MRAGSGAEGVAGASARPFHILIVEDNPAERLLLSEVLRALCPPCQFYAAVDGHEALRFLRRGAGFAEAPTPSLVLLDLHLPHLGMNGLDVLEAIKQDPCLRLIPVVVFTASDAEADVWQAYERHANCFLTKPSDHAAYVATLKSLERFWCHIARLPTAEMVRPRP